ncbi:MAG: arylsulfatase [Planctomycetota bacterium]
MRKRPSPKRAFHLQSQYPLWFISAALSGCLACLILTVERAQATDAPNIIYVICDDLGYGDVNCLAPETCQIETPGADRLAKEGMIFTDMHSGSSVCTPTRYGIMTGRYSWRTKLQKGVVTGFAPSLIDAQRMTVAGFLRTQGYQTAAIGKWHLNFQYLDPETQKPLKQQGNQSPPVGSVVPDGPTTRGFDTYHGFHHARNMEAVVAGTHATGEKVIAHDDPINMLPRLTNQCVETIASLSQEEEPFFLYVPLGSPHTPIVPSAEWQGRSTLGAYGDFVMQTDHVLVEILRTLDQYQIADDTLVIFTSDNGCSKAADIKQLAAKGHIVSGGYRGSKADLWDGGHRIPFIVRWPRVVAAGSQSDQLACLNDLFATVASLLGQETPIGTCEDSVSFLPALSGNLIESTRRGVIHHSYSGHFAYRRGPWKLLLARGSGGWTSPREKDVPKGSPKGQLYNLAKDPSEQHNVFEAEPSLVDSLLADLKHDITHGRSTNGPPSSNDTDKIVLWKTK